MCMHPLASLHLFKNHSPSGQLCFPLGDCKKSILKLRRSRLYVVVKSQFNCCAMCDVIFLEQPESGISMIYRGDGGCASIDKAWGPCEPKIIEHQ